MPIQPGSFCWFECGTHDAAKAKSFYTKLFGWTAEDQPMPGEAPSVYTLLKVDGEDLAGLYELAGPMFEDWPAAWMSYVAVEDADESLARAKRLGATALTEVMDVPGVGRMFFIQDPMGATIAGFEAGEHLGMSSKSNLGWSELHTPDTERAKAFYCELFNWKAKEDPSGGYTEWVIDGQSIGGMMSIPKEEREFHPPAWLPYALVEDCDKSLAKATSLGAELVVPATDIDGVGRFGVFTDPSGAAMAVIKLDHHH